MNGFRDYAIQNLAEVIRDALERNLGSPDDPPWRRQALETLSEFAPGYYDDLDAEAKDPYWKGAK